MVSGEERTLPVERARPLNTAYIEEMKFDIRNAYLEHHFQRLMSHNAYKGPNNSKLYKDQLFQQIRDYSEKEEQDDLPETRIAPTQKLPNQEQDPDTVKVTRSGQVYRTTILFSPTSILIKNVSQICSKRKILELDPWSLYAIQTAILNRMQLVKTETVLNPFERFIFGCGAENLYPQSYTEWGHKQKCSHKKKVRFTLEKKEETSALRFYRADLIVASDYTLSNRERTLLQYSKDPPFCEWFPNPV